MSEKLTHAQAGYREFGTPAQHCSNCSMYRDHNKCTLVANIRWYGYCKYWETEGKK